MSHLGKPIHIKSVAGEPLLDLALDTLQRGKQALVFMMSKRSAEKAAEEIARKIRTRLAEHHLVSQKILTALPRPTKQCERLAKCAARGVVFHHAGLAQKQREIIEDEFRKGTIRIIACTPTLAYGVNLPSYRTLLKSMHRYEGRRGLRWIPVLEYLQYAGRSGRPDFNDSHGEAILIASTDGEREELLERYVRGKPEEIYSKLAVEPVLRTHLLSLIATNTVRSRKAILDFFGRTFWAHQYRDIGRLSAIIDKMLSLLERWEFITVAGSASGFVSADEVEEVKVSATRLGQRVAQLYLDPLTAHELIEGLRQASLQPVEPLSYLHLIASTLEMRPPLGVRMKEQELIQDALLEHHEILLTPEPNIYDSEYDDFLSSMKAALVLYEWIEEKDEHFLLETYKIRPGELRIKLDTADWLVYSLVELGKIIFLKKQLLLLQKLRVRLKYGVKEELLPLLQLKGIGRVRSRQLYTAGLRTLGHLKRAKPGELEAVLGAKLAASVGEQLGTAKQPEKDRAEEGAEELPPGTVRQSQLREF